MLATEIKIKALKKQREFIEAQLKRIPEREDGDSAYPYVGHVYAEVIKYFEEQGFTVTRLQSDSLMSFSRGMPVYLFTVDDSIALTAEELKQAEEYTPEDEEHDEYGGIPEFLKEILERSNG